MIAVGVGGRQRTDEYRRGHAGAGRRLPDQGLKDGNGNKLDDVVEQFKLQGVRFGACEITLRNREMTRQQFIPEATFVPSCVAEIAKLQLREGNACLEP